MHKPSDKKIKLCGKEYKDVTFKIDKKIGKGSYGSVYQIEYLNPVTNTVTTRALKLIENNKKTGINELVELDILSRFRHPNILHHDGFYSNEENIGIVLPLASSNLKDFALDNDIDPSKSEYKILFDQLLSSISFLHESGYYHCDIKPENVLIIDDQLVLADFGLTKKAIFEARPCQTYRYASPQRLYIVAKEFLTLKELRQIIDKDLLPIFTQPTNGIADDIWALGMTLFYMCSKKNLVNVEYVNMKEYIKDLIIDINSLIDTDTMKVYPDIIDSVITDHKMASSIINLLSPDVKERNISIKNMIKTYKLPYFRSSDIISGYIIDTPISKPLEVSTILKSVKIDFYKLIVKTLKNTISESECDSPLGYFLFFNTISLLGKCVNSGYDITKNTIKFIIVCLCLSIKLTPYRNGSDHFIKKLFEVLDIDGVVFPSIASLLELEYLLVCDFGGIIQQKDYFFEHYEYFNLSRDMVIFLKNFSKYFTESPEEYSKHF
jgi:serine/threonine protein kinase